MSASFDLAVAYRIYPRIAKPAMGLPFSHDKLELAERCLRSFRASLGSLRVKMWVLLDGCPKAYEDLFLKYFEPDQLVLISLDGAGNLATFGRQIEILLNQKDADLVYFAEDDYFYLPGQFPIMRDFLFAHEDVDFVSPYDHPDCYRLDFHRGPKWLRIYGDRHWRTAASTCLTFLTRRSTLTETQNVFRSYAQGNRDASLWLSLTKAAVRSPAKLARYAVTDHWVARIMARAWLHNWHQILFGFRRKLWIPIPGIATHMDVNALSPTIDWQARMREPAADASPESLVSHIY